MKTCSVCRQSLPVEQFYKRKRASDGLQSECKRCHNEQMMRRYYRDPEARKRESIAWQKANPERLKKIQARSNKKRSAYLRAYRRENLERQRDQHRAYRSANRAAYVAYAAKRRARAGEESFTDEDVASILKAQRGRCAICRKKLGKKYHVDHIKPISKGGANTRRNIQVTHPACNTSKHAKDPIAFMQEIGRLL